MTSASDSSASQWMVRTKDLFLSRPISKNELIQKIERGELTPLDEVCSSLGYWFGLHETEEVREHLGNVDLSKLSRGLEVEITSSTETRTLNRTLVLELEQRKETVVLPQSAWINPGTPAPVEKTLKPSLKPVPVQWMPILGFCSGFLFFLIYLWSLS